MPNPDNIFKSEHGVSKEMVIDDNEEDEEDEMEKLPLFDDEEDD